MELIDFLTSPNPANHKLAAQLQFANAEWLEAIKKIIDIIENERMEGVQHFTKTLKVLNNSWYIQDIIVRWSQKHKLRKYFIYNDTKICVLRDSDSGIKYPQKEKIEKLLKKIDLCN